MGTLFVVADEGMATSLGGVHNVRATYWDFVSFVFLICSAQFLFFQATQPE